MKLRKFLCALLVCMAVIGCLPLSAKAMEAPSEDIIWLEDMEWEWIDLSTVEYPESSAIPRARMAANGTYPARSICAVGQPLDLKANDLVTFNCSYSPSSAIMDFGVITPEGKFYFTSVKGGSINQAIRISQAGSYSVAIRNNSSQTISVVGFVEY